MSDSDSQPDDEQHQAADQPHSRPPPRKRRRLVISCTECHRRKQKCDRGLPCTNCISRGKEGSCQYETSKVIAKVPADSAAERSPHQNVYAAASHAPQGVDLGYTHNGASTLDVLRRIDNASDGERLASLAAEQGASTAGVRERYKTLIRQLPARTYVEDLVGFYFQDINWQYFGVDEIIFRELMAKWYSVPFAVFSNAGPQGLEPMLREFPALLFQLCACALLYLRENLLDKFDALKYADMTFDDLAMDYSESGAAILSLLGKRQMTLIAPLAGWVRAKFLKHCGMVTESWHQLGTSIRDAQEIGMHRDEKDPRPGPQDSIDESLGKLWMSQARRRVWITLLGWDIHMASVLGRAPQCDFATVSETLPIDVLQSKDGRRMPMIPRPEDSPPTPLTRAIWLFKLVRPLRDIIALEKEGPFPKDFSPIDRIQDSLQDMEAQMPASLRLHNPDTRFDHLPECWWLALTRPTLPLILHFGKLALHRPYIFTRAASRLEALKASFGMLDAQRQYFAILNPSHHRMFSLFYGTFDAVVMIASIYILFPREHSELFPEALQHFEWAAERFDKMAVRNQLARSARSVLNTLHMRLKRIGQAEDRMHVGGGANPSSSRDQIPSPALGSSGPRTSSIPSGSYTSTSRNEGAGLSDSTKGSPAMPTPGSSVSNAGSAPQIGEASSSNEQQYCGSGSNKHNGGESEHANFFARTDTAMATDWTLPADFDLGSIMPLYPIGDLAMNDLMGLGFLGAETAASSTDTGQQQQSLEWATARVAGSDEAVLISNHHQHQQQQQHHDHQDHIPAPNDGGYPSSMAGEEPAALPGNASGSYQTGTSGHPAQGRYQLQSSADGSSSVPPWYFGGDFGNDTVWSLFNQIPWSSTA
ncbi:transcriptional regulatory protein GAL4 [Microdochium nivale]|nr:transcriptional regulatory protein GAL4 [Microdochium nivale]